MTNISPILHSEVRTVKDDLIFGKTPEDLARVAWRNCLLQSLENSPLSNNATTIKIKFLHKKITKDKLNNYKPISLISNFYKIFSKITARKILDENPPTEQAGFHPGYSTTNLLRR